MHRIPRSTTGPNSRRHTNDVMLPDRPLERERATVTDHGPILETDAPPTYARTPRKLIRDPRVSMQARALWTLLDDFASPERPEPFPGQKLLSELTGVDVRTIRRWMSELEDAGWVRITREPTPRGTRNRYRLIWNPTRRTSVSGGQRTSVSGTRRTSVSAEEEPVDVEPVEGENPASGVVEPPPLFAVPDAAPKVRGDGTRAIAKLIVDGWWARQDPKPLQPYPAVLKIVEKALRGGWAERDVAAALDDVAVVSGAALDMWRNQRDKPKNGHRPAWVSDKTDVEQEAEAIERIQQTWGLA